MKKETHAADKAKHIIYDSCETNEENEYWLDDERTNLDRELPNEIIAIADLDLWDGHKSAYKMVGSNLDGILDFFGCDDITVEYDGKDVVSHAYHHDGVNFIRFRLAKDDASLDEIQSLVFDGKATEEDIERLTLSIGGYVSEIYGW